jgi:hypothetical protein
VGRARHPVYNSANLLPGCCCCCCCCFCCCRQADASEGSNAEKLAVKLAEAAREQGLIKVCLVVRLRSFSLLVCYVVVWQCSWQKRRSLRCVCRVLLQHMEKACCTMCAAV